MRELIWYELAGPPPNRLNIWDTGLLGFDGRPRPTFAALEAWLAARRARLGSG